MNIEFHHHITYVLAKEGGYNEDDAATIAYACQYTDDNNDKYEVALDDGAVYENYISQTLNILRPKNKLVRIYTCFHFFPGTFLSDDARRTDCSLHLFNTTPGSPNAQVIFNAALESGNLYRIGIATHCYSDTWAHQNFVGFKHTFGDRKGFVPWLMPSIGHADFQHQPDIANLEWTDPRLLEQNATINNKRRFLLAARSIFKAFAERNGLKDIDTHWADLAEKLGRAIGADCSDVKECRRTQAVRIAAYRAICPEMPDYREREWLTSAVEPTSPWWQRAGDRLWQGASTCPNVGSLLKAYWPKGFRVRRFRAKDGFQQSAWFRFQEAVKAHQADVMDLLDDLYEHIGADVRKVL